MRFCVSVRYEHEVLIALCIISCGQTKSLPLAFGLFGMKVFSNTTRGEISPEVSNCYLYSIHSSKVSYQDGRRMLGSVFNQNHRRESFSVYTRDRHKRSLDRKVLMFSLSRK
ncbi:hypothetical protein CDAR_95551 [Caerostris darwini]|uniref:Uncharacterized protein n=1 Tax=Caerostris darwini TaxID=1538125 RepID=A0AAV4M737_9ARAC|nr:hypothetical protein CDAR_95551 [Caerostris darwini]